MNKRYLHHAWRTFRRVKPWYFVVLTILFGTVCLLSLRHNNEQMIKLRDAVYAADQKGTDVEAPIRNLRSYVYSHMNTGLSSGPNAVHPPIQLKYTYERLLQAQQTTLGQGNSALYAQAQQYCESQSDVGSEVIACIQQYARTHGAAVAVIPDSLYKFDFTSAKWSPDLAGWTLVLTILSALGFLASGVYHWFIKKYVL